MLLKFGSVVDTGTIIDALYFLGSMNALSKFNYLVCKVDINLRVAQVESSQRVQDGKNLSSECFCRLHFNSFC